MHRSGTNLLAYVSSVLSPLPQRTALSSLSLTLTPGFIIMTRRERCFVDNSTKNGSPLIATREEGDENFESTYFLRPSDLFFSFHFLFRGRQTTERNFVSQTSKQDRKKRRTVLGCTGEISLRATSLALIGAPFFSREAGRGDEEERDNKGRRKARPEILSLKGRLVRQQPTFPFWSKRHLRFPQSSTLHFVRPREGREGSCSLSRRDLFAFTCRDIRRQVPSFFSFFFSRRTSLSPLLCRPSCFFPGWASCFE